MIISLTFSMRKFSRLEEMLSTGATKRQVTSTDMMRSQLPWWPTMPWHTRCSRTSWEDKKIGTVQLWNSEFIHLIPANRWDEMRNLWMCAWLSHFGGVWRSCQHHVNRAAWEKLHTRRAEAEHWLVYGRRRQWSTTRNVPLPHGRDGGQEGSTRGDFPLAGFCGGQEAISPPVHPVYPLAMVGQLEVVLAWAMTYRTYTGQRRGCQ